MLFADPFRLPAPPEHTWAFEVADLGEHLRTVRFLHLMRHALTERSEEPLARLGRELAGAFDAPLNLFVVEVHTALAAAAPDEAEAVGLELRIFKPTDRLRRLIAAIEAAKPYLPRVGVHLERAVGTIGYV